MPEDIYYATVVPLDETFLLVGGYSDTIYKYQKDNDTWTLMETRLPSAVRSPIAMMVDVDIFPSC